MFLSLILAPWTGGHDNMTCTPPLAILLMCISLGVVAGCTDRHSSAAPAAPSPIPQPAPQPTRLQPTVTAITPNTASTAGGAWGTISGAQFQSGATVRLGDGAVQWAWLGDQATILFCCTPSHPAGTVDVVVTNPGGLSGKLAGAYTFAPRESFDFTGDWIGHAGDDYEIDMRFAIRNNALVSLVCGSSEAVTLTPPPSVHDGAFSFLGGDGIAISGQLVSPTGAEGTINVPGCPRTTWWADKSDAVQSVGAR
jgi:IPT/TIG domain-containing protein